MQTIGWTIFIEIFMLITMNPLGLRSVQAQDGLEITKTDIFAIRDWDRSQVTVLGFKLGMARADAINLAKGNSSELLNSTPTNTGQTCSQNMCSVRVGGHATFVDLIFGEDERVADIEMELFVVDAGGALWIAQQMKGLTQQLAMHYSDKLRIQLLGREDEHCVQNPQMARPLVQQYFDTYEYYRRGIIFSVNRVEKGSATSPSLSLVEVRMSLVSPKKTK